MKKRYKVLGILALVLALFVMIVSTLYYTYMRKIVYTSLVSAGSLHSACLVVETSDNNKAIEILNWAMDYSISNCLANQKFLSKKDQNELSTLTELLNKHRKEYSWYYPSKTNNTIVVAESIYAGERRRAKNHFKWIKIDTECFSINLPSNWELAPTTNLQKYVIIDNEGTEAASIELLFNRVSFLLIKPASELNYVYEKGLNYFHETIKFRDGNELQIKQIRTSYEHQDNIELTIGSSYGYTNYNANVISNILNSVKVDIKNKKLPKEVKHSVNNEVPIDPFGMDDGTNKSNTESNVTNQHACGSCCADAIQAEKKQIDEGMVDYGPVIYISSPSTNAIYFTSFLNRNNKVCTWATLTNRIDQFYGFDTNVSYLTEIKASGQTPVFKVTELIDFLKTQYNQESYILFNSLKCYQSPMLIKRMEEEIKFNDKQKTDTTMWYY